MKEGLKVEIEKCLKMLRKADTKEAAEQWMAMAYKLLEACLLESAEARPLRRVK